MTTDNTTVTIYLAKTEDRPNEVHPRLIEFPDGQLSFFDPETGRNDFSLLIPYVNTYIRLVLEYEEFQEETIYLVSITENKRENGSKYDLEYYTKTEWEELQLREENGDEDTEV